MQIIRFEPKVNAQSDPVSPALHDTFFLHGFPGIRSRQNRDMAEPISRLVKRTSQVLLYTGLGCAPGEFLFSKCLKEVGDHFQKHFDTHPGKIDLVGHSWGGFLSLYLAGRFPERIRKLVLMSPLLKFFTEADATTGFKQLSEEHPEISLGDTVRLAHDFVLMPQNYPVAPVIRKTKIPTLFLQARVDDRTPLEVAEEHKLLFSNDLAFEILETDHSFLEDREKITERIARYLA